MVIFLQRTFTSLVHAHAGRTQIVVVGNLQPARNDEYLTTPHRLQTPLNFGVRATETHSRCLEFSNILSNNSVNRYIEQLSVEKLRLLCKATANID